MVPSVLCPQPPPLPAPSPTVCPCSFSWGPHCLPASASKVTSGLQSCSSLGSIQYSHSSLCSQLSPPAPPRPTPPHLLVGWGQSIAVPSPHVMAAFREFNLGTHSHTGLLPVGEDCQKVTASLCLQSMWLPLARWTTTSGPSCATSRSASCKCIWLR